jgi:hypothetical protein
LVQTLAQDLEYAPFGDLSPAFLAPGSDRNRVIPELLDAGWSAGSGQKANGANHNQSQRPLPCSSHMLPSLSFRAAGAVSGFAPGADAFSQRG